MAHVAQNPVQALYINVFMLFTAAQHQCTLVK